MTHRACPDPDVPDAEWEAFKEDERYESPEPPRLNDPPAPVKTCGGCEWYAKGMCFTAQAEEVDYDDEACGAWEGEE